VKICKNNNWGQATKIILKSEMFEKIMNIREILINQEKREMYPANLVRHRC